MIIKKNFFDMNLTIMKVAGLWIPDRGENIYQKCMFIIYNILVVGFSVCYGAPTEVLAFAITYHHVEEFMKNVSVGGTHILAIIKICVWYRNRKTILNIMNTLQEKASQYESINDFNPEKIIKEEKSVKDITTKIFLTLGISVSVTAFLASTATILFDYQKYEKYTVGPHNTTEYHYTQHLPYYMVVPFAYDTSKTKFAFTVMYNCFPAFHFAWVIIGIDTIFTSLISNISAQLRILQGAFQTIRQRCLRDKEILDIPILHDSEIINRAMKSEMKKCVLHLQLVFDTCKKMEEMFSYLTLAQVLSSQILICSCLYMVSAIPITSKAFVTELVYLVAIEMQIMLYCFFGNKVTLTGEEISLALYTGDWYSASKSFKNSMMITMIRMRRPIYLTIGKFSPLTLTTFVSIGRASYSLFAVLKNQK